MPIGTGDWAISLIDILTKAELLGSPSLYDAMHRLRFRVFRRRLNWDVCGENGLERDEFDDLNPHYVLAMDEHDRLVGTWRMLPTTGPYVLQQVFAHLLEDRTPACSELIWEGSRFAIDCDYVGTRGLGALHKTSAEIFCGVVEFCIAYGIKEIVTVYDLRIARLLPRLGVHHKWISRQHRIGNTIAMTGAFDSSVAMLRSIRQETGITGSVVQNAPWIQPRKAA